MVGDNVKLYHIQKHNRLFAYDELQFDGKEYFTYEYSRQRKKMTQIGILTKEEANRVIVKQFNQEVVRLTLDEDSRIWYHRPKEWIEDNYNQKTDGIFGINAGGSFEVVAYNDKNEEIETAIVNITPGTMSLEEYKQIQLEVRKLFELFSYDLSERNIQEENILKRVQFPLYPQREFIELLNHFSEYTLKIMEAPEQQLTVNRQKIHIHQVKKWKPSIIIENSIKQNGRVTADVIEKTYDIKEHQMIRFMAEEFQRRIEVEVAMEKKQLILLMDEIRELQDVERKEQSNLVFKFRSLINILLSDCAKLQQRSLIWNDAANKVNEILDVPLLQCEPMTIEETHTFRMHPIYSEVYEIYLAYEELSPVLTETFRAFIQSLLKSPTLYEVWVLLKIIHYFSEWGLDAHEFVVDIQKKYKDSKSISGYKKQFRLENRPFDIGIYYDFTFDGSGYRPDFVIGFFEKENKQWSLHTLDAKYKCYSEMTKGEQTLLNDLKHSCTRYLNDLFDGDLKVKSATLIHTDIKSLNWNVKEKQVNTEDNQHTIAHFHFTPFESKNLQIYLKRLLHENSGLDHCCPKCGQFVEGIIQNTKEFQNKISRKILYNCSVCEEVWVANFCSSCSYHGRNMKLFYYNGYPKYLARQLYKYPTHNYNIQVGESWDVHCPNCYKTFDHKINYIVKHTIRNEPMIIRSF